MRQLRYIQFQMGSGNSLIIGVVVLFLVFSSALAVLIKNDPQSGECGGVLATRCAFGYSCVLKDSYSDASGLCINVALKLKWDLMPPNFTCPDTPHINCLPGPYIDQKKCDKEYIAFVSRKCPQFEGVVE